ncbi:hypothetical protein C8J57DRAFT_1511425 [Mycena rebaudengoi]|nr:hypothetical protein C8J57DRAFT_1511425 [Mycena rebaudengoi]
MRRLLRTRCPLWKPTISAPTRTSPPLGRRLHPTDKQCTAMVERTSELRRKIVAWMEVQVQFFPQVVTLCDLDAVVASVGDPEERGFFSSEVLKYEYRMRVGQAHEALHDIQQQLLVRRHLYKLKDNHARGVAANTRSNDKIAALFSLADRVGEGARTVLAVEGRGGFSRGDAAHLGILVVAVRLVESAGGTTEPAQLEGETAYVSRQAAFLSGLATRFAVK